MAGVWEQYDIEKTFTTPATQQSELFQNEEDTDNFQSADIVGVDGIITIITDTDDLCRVRLLIAPESNDGSDVAAIPFHSPGQWYSWFCARGPLVFRLRSKKTIPPEHKLWMQTAKVRGSSTTVIRVGAMFLWVLKH